MSELRAGQSLQHLGRALERLREALQGPEANSLVVDGTSQSRNALTSFYNSGSWRALIHKRGGQQRH
jgi:hypothetical protein